MSSLAVMADVCYVVYSVITRMIVETAVMNKTVDLVSVICRSSKCNLQI